MSIASEHRRLDAIEIYLTPKEWIIQLADKMRLYPHEKDFWEAVLKEDCRECLLIKPFLKLDQQAQLVYPSKGRPDIDQRIELSHKLRTEFQELKIFIYRLNGIIENKAEQILLTAALQASRLQILILEDRFGGVAQAAAACIKRRTDEHRETPRILALLRSFAAASQTQGSQIGPLSENLVMFAKNILAHEASLQLAQDRYFDGHPILFRNIEDTLKETIKVTTNSLEEFNGFFSIHERVHVRAIRERPGLIDVEKIMKDARTDATLDILGLDRAHRWEIFRATTKDGLKSVMEASGGTSDKQ
jgi:hypothetical protein